MRPEVFVDTSFAIALSATSDRLHEVSLRIARDLKASRTRLVTTQAVLLEVGNALSKRAFRVAAARLLASLEADPLVEVEPLTEGVYQQAFELFQARSDKEWGLIDCVSFVVMNARGITEALTADGHFEQAGFRALLRDE